MKKYMLRKREIVETDDLMEWARWFEGGDEARRVALTQVTPDIRVSTVFLSVDHNFGDGPPILFETMVFGGDIDGTQERYHTWAEAEAGHAAIVVCATAAAPPPPPAASGRGS